MHCRPESQTVQLLLAPLDVGEVRGQGTAATAGGRVGGTHTHGASSIHSPAAAVLLAPLMPGQPPQRPSSLPQPETYQGVVECVRPAPLVAAGATAAQGFSPLSFHQLELGGCFEVNLLHAVASMQPRASGSSGGGGGTAGSQTSAVYMPAILLSKQRLPREPQQQQQPGARQRPQPGWLQGWVEEKAEQEGTQQGGSSTGACCIRVWMYVAGERRGAASLAALCHARWSGEDLSC